MNPEPMREISREEFHTLKPSEGEIRSRWEEDREGHDRAETMT
jgi:hypothetical protein